MVVKTGVYEVDLSVRVANNRLQQANIKRLGYGLDNQVILTLFESRLRHEIFLFSKVETGPGGHRSTYSIFPHG